MKEITLQELLNMADAAAHDGIGDFWNQKSIHYLVVFTSENEDFEIIGVGPTLPFPTLEAASAHSIPGKQPEYFLKCPGALAGRLQPKLAPGKLGLRSTPPSPSLKGRTTVPFPKSSPEVSFASEPIAPKDVKDTEPAAKIAVQILKPEPSPPPPSALTPTTEETPSDLTEREKAIQQREQELTQREESLKARETALRERETAIIAFAERLRHLSRG